MARQPQNPARRVAVIDIGKTNAKLALVDLAGLGESGVRKTPNTVAQAGPYPHFDGEALWDFILDGLAGIARETPFEAISVTTHGAAFALLKKDGTLAMPVLDYEHDGPDGLRAEYDAIRPPFSETGSPRLPGGLNAGAQLFWQEQAFPAPWAEVAHVVPLPQYWAFRLSGVLAGEATSLGTHTDLWNPRARDVSSLVASRGWGAKFPPLRRAGDRLGTIREDLAARLSLDPDIAVLCGIHDSNASLLPHLLTRETPFAVVSTGTWVILFAVGGRPQVLDPARDTLMNVNAFADPVPSARFMGGREYALLTESLSGQAAQADVEAVLRGQILLLPTVQPGTGPFPNQTAEWLPARPAEPGRQLAAIGFYLACMTATALELIGADGPTVVEGPVAGNGLFLRMLRAATGRPVVADPGGGTGTSIGAALLAAEGPPGGFQLGTETAAPPGPEWQAYAERWRAEAEQRRTG